MYQQFDILTLACDLPSRSIVIECSHDVDEDSVSNDSILLGDESGNLINAAFVVNGKVITATLQDWPVANTEYSLLIQPLLKTIAGDGLKTAVKRKLVFKSTVLSTVSILAPANYETCLQPYLVWQEHSKNGEALISRYGIEISSDTGFFKIVTRTTVANKVSIALKTLLAGQYFARVRAESPSGDVGIWSEPVTFIIQKEGAIDANNDLWGPTIDKDIEIIEQPANGDTPSSFLFVFSEEVDPDAIGDIVVTRRVV